MVSSSEAQPDENRPVGFVDDEASARSEQALQLQLRQLQVEYVKAVTEQKKQDQVARKPFLVTVGIFAILQLLCANVVFIWYAKSLNWSVPPGAISAWLGATVAQVIAVLLVLANNLFPKRENEPLPDPLAASSSESPVQAAAPPVV